jgi:DNA invertase Pin-like site-specific DNA recombinase
MSVTNQTKNYKLTNIDIPTEFEDKVSELLVNLMMVDQKYEEEENDSKEEWDVTRVSDHRITPEGVWQFFVHFKGVRGGTWIDDSDCDCENFIKRYLDKSIRTIYCVCRVSSKNQTGPRHISLEAQEHKLVSTAREKFGDVNVRIKILKISASAYKGIPIVLKRLGDATRSGDAILTYRVDRLSRNIVKFLGFIEELNDRGVLIYAQDENIWYDKNKLEFIQGILDANKEAVIIGKRVKLSLELRKKRGDEVFGSVPFGYKTKREKNRRVIMDDNLAEQNVINRIKEEIGQGKTVSEIATGLNFAGIKKRGRKWTAAMVNYTFVNRGF